MRKLERDILKEIEIDFKKTKEVIRKELREGFATRWLKLSCNEDFLDRIARAIQESKDKILKIKET